MLATVFETFTEQGKREHKKAKKPSKSFLEYKKLITFVAPKRGKRVLTETSDLKEEGVEVSK